MLKQRVLTAVVLLPPLIFLLIFGSPYAVFGLLLLCTALSLYEMTGIFLDPMQKKFLGYGSPFYSRMMCIVLGCLILSLSAISEFNPFLSLERGSLIFCLGVILLLGLFCAKSLEHSMVQMSAFVVCISYAALPWISIWDLYLMGPESRFVFLTLVVVWAQDTGAYFAGKKFGKRPLAPLLSPKKSWEGAIGGVLSSTVAAFILNLVYLGALGPFWLMLLVGAFGGIGGILGDLMESSFKRFSGIKDSGMIFPGHGGFLDRTDSLLFAAPTVWFVLRFYS